MTRAVRLTSRLASSCLVATLAAGCTDADYPSNLAEASGLTLRITGHVADSNEPGTIGRLSVAIDGPDRCIRADSGLDARLADSTVTSKRYGDNSDEWCDAPSLTLELGPGARAPSQVLTVGDTSRTITVVLGDLMVLPAVALVTPADGIVHRGEPVALSWSHPASGDDLGFIARIDGDYAELARDRTTGLVGGIVDIRNPGRAGLDISARQTSPQPVVCAGASCTVDLSWSSSIDIVTAP